MIDFKKELNQAQYEVVTKSDGPSLVLAGAGSGKTRTLVYRVAYLLEQGVAPERIMLLTFTNKAAHEMLSRVDELLQNKKQATGLWGGTFHHVANRLLRTMGSAVGLKRNFSILDREDSKDMLKRIVKELGGATQRGRRMPQPGVFLEVVSYAANAQIGIPEALEKKYPEGLDMAEVFTTVAERYAERKRAANALDFDDLLICWLRLLGKPALQKKLQGLWQYILVDEYQDTNTVQDEIVRLLAADHKNILVVGDDAQSIYSFRAAEIRNILDFPKRFPDTKIYKLEENYRSSPEILEVANEVIRFNTDQFQKTLFTEQDTFVKPELILAQEPVEEAELIAERIMALEDEGVPLQTIAVLFRAAHQSQALELELNKRRIPYEMRGGLRFFERVHIKDMLAYVRLIANPADEVSWYRILATHEGIGDVTARKIIEQMSGVEDLRQLTSHDIQIGAAARIGWLECTRGLTAAQADAANGPGAIIRAVRQLYKKYLELHYADFKDRLDDLEQLALFSDGYDKLDDFIADTSLQEAYALRRDAEKSREPSVVLTTIHQAKGLEWNTVFIMHMTNSSLPHARALFEEGGLEEERRLFYVAITRAQRRLYLLYPLSSSKYSISLNQPSQFLKEIKPELLTGRLELEDDEAYITINTDGERSYLPSIEDL